MSHQCRFHRSSAPRFLAFDVRVTSIRSRMRLVGRVGRGSDPCGWERAPEWWGTQGGGWGRQEGEVVFEEVSRVGNGIVQVTSHHCEEESGEDGEINGTKKLEWRVLRFNETTRQSVAKVAVIWDPTQKRTVETCQVQCLAFEYLKTMGALAITIMSAREKKEGWIKALFVGLGGGSLPLYLQHKWSGLCQCHIVELDETVLHAASTGMGLSPYLFKSENFKVFLEDGAKFIQAGAGEKSDAPYDLIVIDAFDGADEIPQPFRTLDTDCLRQMNSILHPSHGTVLLNMHGGKITSAFEWELQKLLGAKNPGFNWTDPLGRQIVEISQAYICALQPRSAFTVSCSKQDNIILVLSNTASLSRKKMAHLATGIATKSDVEFRLDNRVQRHFWDLKKDQR